MSNVSLIDGHIDEPKSKIIKCTGERCPMQIGYDVANCQCEGCSYRTTPMTNYDCIRNMSVEEMAEFILMMAIGYCSGQAPKNIKERLETEVTE